MTPHDHSGDSGKEIPAVNVDRRGNLIQWVRNSVNNRNAAGLHL